MLHALEPMLLVERKRAFSDPAYLVEPKHDGYRLLVEVDGGTVRMKSRRGADATGWYPELVRGLSGNLPGGRHVIDAEVCVLDDLGRSDFNRLHARSALRGWRSGADLVVAVAFDLLVTNGVDVRSAPLEERKEALRQLLDTHRPPATLYLQHLPGEAGEQLYEYACALHLEGVVMKLRGTPYRSGERSQDWLKIKRPGATPAQRFQRDPMPT